MIFIQQIEKFVSPEKASKIKDYGVVLYLKRNFLQIVLFNKWLFMSLFSEKVTLTFVSSTNTDRFHLPMTQNYTYHSSSSKPFLGLGKMLLMATMVLFCFASNAQGWEIYFGSNFDDYGYSIVQTRNQDFLITGYSQGFGAGNTGVYVVRTDVDGRKVWERLYDEGHISYGYSIIETDDDAFLIVGQITNVPQNNQSDVFLLKIDNRGELIWTKQFGGAGNDAGFRIIPSQAGGGYLIVGRTASFGNGGNDAYLVKIDSDGNQEWSKTYGSSGEDIGWSAVETIDGYMVVGSGFNIANNSTDVYLFKVDFNGNELWGNKFFGTTAFDEGQKIVSTDDGNYAITGSVDQDAYLLKVTPGGSEIWSTTYGGALGTVGQDVLSTTNGDLVVTGAIEVNDSNVNAFLLRYDVNGTKVWDKTIGRSTHIDWAQSVIQTKDKGFAVAGGAQPAQFGSNVNDVSFIKANSDGDVYTNNLSGKIFIDDNEDCTFTSGEAGLNEWIVKAKSASNTFFGTSDSEGNYDITIEEGDYSVSVFVKNKYWESCVASYNVSFNAQYDTLTRNFPILKSTLCPLLEVDVSAPVAQNCSNIGYSVDYCNNGTVGVADPTVEIILDENLIMTGASIPFTQIGDSLYVFEIDSLGIDECGNFNFAAESSCNGEPFEAYIVSAHISPDSICLPTSGWDMSNIKVNGYCDTDSIRFEIINDGAGDMELPLNFIIIEDHVMSLNGADTYFLNASEDTTIIREATGATYRLIAQQAPGHPGNSYPTIAVEGCTTGGSYSTGYVTELQEDENDPFVSIDVQEAISSTDYIFMRGYPKGYLENGDRLIPANTPLQYHIYFQNLGTDTINRLVIRDTLPESLELSTVVPGASSHPYQFEAYSNGVLRFTFENLDLSPGSDTASNGFVQFKISQKPNNPEGTVIPNSAAVFLGYDEPAQTTTVTHVVGMPKPLIQLVNWVSEPMVPGVEVSAYPNPFTSSIVFEIEENQSRFKTLTLTVFDMSGRLVRQEKAAGNQLQLDRGNLLAGMYTFQLEADGLLLNTGKIIVR